VWKDFPLPQHAQAPAAAEAAQCAGAQGKFWEYHDLLFQAQDNLGDATYQAIAAQLGLDAARFASCRANHERQPLIKRNFEEGVAAGVDSTPYLLVNGTAWSGVFTADELDGMLRQALGQ
jgi:protein-disulfide isomerase